MRIDINNNIEVNKMILNLNQCKFINKQMKEEEVNKLIKELSLFNPTRTEPLTINQLVKHLEELNINTHIHKQIDLNNLDEDITISLYRFSFN